MLTILRNILLLIVLISSLLSQEYIWPIQAKKELTAVFAEERPGRYHTGVDIRTFGIIGYKLISIDDGYISRIRTSSKGYGKTIYIKLNDGHTAVYAHLDRFTDELDNFVHALQQSNGKYTIDHRFTENEHPVKKGAIIGYSGDTGGISGPHLHFEIRNEEGQPINPFHHSINIIDNDPPIAESIAVIPLNEDAEIDGFKEQKIYKLHKISDNKYILPDTIFVSGDVGLAVKAIDKITDQHFNFGIYSANLLLDASFIYSMQYDEINWESANQIYSERNFPLKRLGLGRYYHLFSYHNNQSLPFINSKSSRGYYFDDKVLHDAIIDIYDYAKNKIEVHAYFVSDTLPKYKYDVIFNNNECLVTFNTKNFIRPHFYLTGIDSKDPKKSTEYFDLGNNQFLINILSPPFNVLEIFAKNKFGVSSPSSFHMAPHSNFSNINGEFKIKHYEHGIIISFVENYFSGMEAYLSINKLGDLYSYDLSRTSKLTLSSDILNPVEFENAKEIKIYYKSTDPFEIFSKKLSGEIVLPDSNFNINLIDNQINLIGESNTFYDTTFIWAEEIITSPPNEGKIIKGPYFIKPYLIPFNKKVQLNFLLEPFFKSKNIGVFTFNKKKSKWNHISSEILDDFNYINADISSGEIFAIIEENISPSIYNLIPDINGTYYSNDIKNISFNVKDTFSGINGEADIIVKLDGKSIVVEYNSYQEKIRYPLKYNLKKGSHTLYVQATDKVGNKTILDGNFYIK